MSVRIGRDRSRRPRAKSRLRTALEEQTGAMLEAAFKDNSEAERVLVGHKREIQDIDRDEEVIKRKANEESSDLEKDETKVESERKKLREDVKSEQESITRRINLIDAQSDSESRRIHLLAQRGGRIITQNATLPPNERKGTEVIETEVETSTRRLLELRQQKSELEERSHRLERDLALESQKKDEQLAEIKERKRRLTADKEQRLAEKETARIRAIEDAQHRLKAK